MMMGFADRITATMPISEALRERLTQLQPLLVILLAGGMLFATSARADRDTDWIRGAIPALQKSAHDWDAEETKQVTPPVIAVQTHDRDPLGVISTLQPAGPTMVCLPQCCDFIR